MTSQTAGRCIRRRFIFFSFVAKGEGDKESYPEALKPRYDFTFHTQRNFPRLSPPEASAFTERKARNPYKTAPEMLNFAYLFTERKYS